MKEAYAALPKKRKQYFDELVSYAMKKPDTEKKEDNSSVLVESNGNPYLKLKIKKDAIIAYFKIEDSKSEVLKVSNVPVKTRQTEIRVVDEQSFEAAKYMINVQFKRFTERKGKK